MKTKYNIKLNVEFGKNIFLLVTVPEKTNKEDIHNNFEMAYKYAWIFFNEDKNTYDEHYEDMLHYKTFSSSQDTFIYYLEKHCGYKVEEYSYDYEYEF